jgi:hypothetical protein
MNQTRSENPYHPLPTGEPESSTPWFAARYVIWTQVVFAAIGMVISLSAILPQMQWARAFGFMVVPNIMVAALSPALIATQLWRHKRMEWWLIVVSAAVSFIQFLVLLPLVI